ncbi:MAG TPA: phytoene/squalene synthase family protein [Yinghuangia sp.]|uniref:phytoene/squalene synthase family protein n=1 Tax=Yinghuangia sp. YIM S10712 TaxID=3436930 RepID=UPI002BAB591A|nr:phytoene/squalene synthase family protein [Yinghuangia sp.]
MELLYGDATGGRSRTAEPVTLSAAYERCRRLHARHGRSYYLATMLLPRWKRRHVHALYGFARYADEIVDARADTRPGERLRELRRFTGRLRRALDGVPVDDPILPAVVHTVRAFDLDRADFEAFAASMEADLTRTHWDTYEDLLTYMEGSAAVIGTMTTPILEPVDRAAAREPARQLGFAFQLTNFIRDVGEDLARGRIYLPMWDLDRFKVRPADLAAGRVTDGIRDLLRFEMGRAWAHYRAAAPGIAMLASSSRPCIATAFTLYSGILREVERSGYQVLTGRVTVPRRTRLAVAARHAGRAAIAARAERRVSVTSFGDQPPAGVNARVR